MPPTMKRKCIFYPRQDFNIDRNNIVQLQILTNCNVPPRTEYCLVNRRQCYFADFDKYIWGPLLHRITNDLQISNPHRSPLHFTLTFVISFFGDWQCCGEFCFRPLLSLESSGKKEVLILSREKSITRAVITKISNKTHICIISTLLGGNKCVDENKVCFFN